MLRIRGNERSGTNFEISITISARGGLAGEARRDFRNVIYYFIKLGESGNYQTILRIVYANKASLAVLPGALGR